MFGNHLNGVGEHRTDNLGKSLQGLSIASSESGKITAGLFGGVVNQTSKYGKVVSSSESDPAQRLMSEILVRFSARFSVVNQSHRTEAASVIVWRAFPIQGPEKISCIILG